MKTKIYVRVGKALKGASRGRTYIRAGSTPDYSPIENTRGFVPTVAFALEVDIPDALFTQAERVIAELDVEETGAKIAVEIQSPEKQ